MYEVSFMGCKAIKAVRATDACLKLTVTVSEHGLTDDGDYTGIRRLESINLFGLPENVKDAIIAALSETEPAE